jgi:hypothetical protein
VFERLDAPFAEKGKDVSNGDVVTIIGDVVTRLNRFNPEKDQKVIKIKCSSGERYIGLNQDSINVLIDEFKSNETKDWINKRVKVLLSKKVIGGKRVVVAYLVGLDWELDDYGAPSLPGAQKEPDDSIPTIKVDEEENEVRVKDIPF